MLQKLLNKKMVLKVFFESVIETGKEPSDAVMLKVYDGYNAEWKETYRKQAAALKNF